MEKIGYALLIIAAVAVLFSMFKGLIAAWPHSIIAFIAIAGIALLLVKAAKDRVASEEDDYYDKNVQK